MLHARLVRAPLAPARVTRDRRERRAGRRRLPAARRRPPTSRATAASSATRTSCRRASCATWASPWSPSRPRPSARARAAADLVLGGLRRAARRLRARGRARRGRAARARPRRPRARERPAPGRRQQRLPPLPAAARPRRGGARRGRRRRRGRVDLRGRAARADGAARLHGRVDGRAADGVDRHADAVQRARGARRRVRPRPARRARDRAADGRQLRGQDLLPAGADRRRAGAQGGPAGAGRARPRRGLRDAQPPPGALPHAARRAARRHLRGAARVGLVGHRRVRRHRARTSPRRAAGRPSGRTASTTSRSTPSASTPTARRPAPTAATRPRRPSGPASSASTCWPSASASDPLELRLQNVLRDGEAFCTGEVLHDFRVAECLEDVAERIGWRRDRARQGPLRADEGHADAEPLRGRDRARRRRLRRALGDHGDRPGRRRRAARPGRGGARRGARRRSRMGPVDTDLVPFDTRTTSSRSTHMMAGALAGAAAELRARIAEQLEAAPGDLVLAEGHASRARRAGAARARWRTSAPLRGEGAWRVDGGLDPDTGQGVASAHWHQGAGAAEVRRGRGDGPRRGRAASRPPSTPGRSSTRCARSCSRTGSLVMGARQRAVRVARLRRRAGRERQPLRLRRPDLRRRAAARLDVLLEREGAEVHGLGETALPLVPAAVGNALRALGPAAGAHAGARGGGAARPSTRATGRRREDRRRAQRRGGGAGGRRRGAAAGRAAARRASPASARRAGSASAAPARCWSTSEPISSCLLLAPLAAGRRLTTLEGLGDDPVQQAFDRLGAYQCGYCTPGMVLTARALLAREPDPSPAAHPRGARGQPLPLRLLRAHRRRGAVGGRRRIGVLTLDLAPRAASGRAGSTPPTCCPTASRRSSTAAPARTSPRCARAWPRTASRSATCGTCC